MHLFQDRRGFENFRNLLFRNANDLVAFLTCLALQTIYFGETRTETYAYE